MADKAEEPDTEEEHDEEELQSLQEPGNMNDIYEDYLNDQVIN